MKILKISPKILSKKVFKKNISSKFIFFEKLKGVIGIIIIILFIITLSQLSEEKNTETVKGELIFVLDTSLSMLATDEKDLNNKKISRIDSAKNIINNIIDQNKGYKFGLIIFSGKSHIMLPPTSDTNSFKTILSGIKPDSTLGKGNVLKDTINKIITLSKSSELKIKKSVLISDGEFHEDLVDMQKLNKQNIKIISIGVGSPDGSKIPIKTKPGGGVLKYKKYKGQSVISKINEKTLLEIAQKSDGKYFKSKQTKEIYNYLRNNTRLEKKGNFDKIEFLLILIFLLICFEMVINRVKTRCVVNERLY